ncbi:Plasmid stabilization system protein ParE [Janthinobacterium sp. TND4EL3]|uniref:type II toxin-antitoxin system RelE/ParE family toxin n=1 Tax=Janthinobacterium sp. TND4EL3 TaxID=1907311 RepID=UPI0009556532|nr:type II toxin-antitoxin system RelE/ParE family toxin [Janthinobacterium sp. TND4EL3]SIR84806.1 Plasmid stabilization system protein ParE [Janthinobacterium sp. TND4EL3]
MELLWTGKALSDLTRLHEFLATANKSAAGRAVQALTAAALTLVSNPRIGERLEEFEPREVRRILVGRYELRYEIVQSTIFVLRLWHTREER